MKSMFVAVFAYGTDGEDSAQFDNVAIPIRSFEDLAEGLRAYKAEYGDPEDFKFVGELHYPDEIEFRSQVDLEETGRVIVDTATIKQPIVQLEYIPMNDLTDDLSIFCERIQEEKQAEEITAECKEVEQKQFEIIKSRVKVLTGPTVGIRSLDDDFGFFLIPVSFDPAQ